MAIKPVLQPDERVEIALDETFPASDPPAFMAAAVAGSPRITRPKGTARRQLPLVEAAPGIAPLEATGQSAPTEQRRAFSRKQPLSTER
jgi:hypothetical protein